ncbi:hypothetical protein [Caballeronia sp. RCC_10]|uniref:hypothetical protein n=1 Tax=Caballeronia sp. RCC_10 TaxID=3239227 RepID=UPI0035264E2C
MTSKQDSSVFVRGYGSEESVKMRETSEVNAQFIEGQSLERLHKEPAHRFALLDTEHTLWRLRAVPSARSLQILISVKANDYQGYPADSNQRTSGKAREALQDLAFGYSMAEPER